jgi:hypothetical protein
MRHDKRLDVRVPEDLLRRIDEWRSGQLVPPSKASAIRCLLEAGMAATAVPIFEVDDE